MALEKAMANNRMNVFLSIITATYNRKHTIQRVYDSLITQTDKDFEWVIIDDGSDDGTDELIESFKSSNLIIIKYRYKQNGGLHAAHNDAVRLAAGKLILLLDSDDWLRKDAVKIIKRYWSKYEEDPTVASIVFLDVDKNGNVIGKMFPKNEFRSNHIECRFNLGINGDKAEVTRSSIMKKQPFIIMPGEKHSTSALIWNRIAKEYSSVYFNIPLKYVEYQCDGLTNNYMKYARSAPRTMALFYNEMTASDFRPVLRGEAAIKYIIYSSMYEKNIFRVIRACYDLKAFLFIPLGLVTLMYRLSKKIISKRYFSREG